MPLRRFLTKLSDSSSAKEVDACKTAIKDELVGLAKTQRDSRELHAAVQQLIDLYFTKKGEFIVDIVANFPETVANELLKQLSDKILFAHKEYVSSSSGTSQSYKYYEMLCVSLEFLLKAVSRGPWWNQQVITTTWSAFLEIIRDRALGSECYISVVYILSICVPYSIASLDERLILWLCSIANTLLNRIFKKENGSSNAVAQQMVEENMKSSVMQLVLILYGIIPITFIKQLMQNCPSDVVDFVVSQLRLHPILSQHLAQRAQLPTATDLQPQQNQMTTSSVIGGGGLSQAECKSKNRFRGKDFSDIVTECLNYEATSPPKMFSADFPAASLCVCTSDGQQHTDTLPTTTTTVDEGDDLAGGGDSNHVDGEVVLTNGKASGHNRWSAFDSNKLVAVGSGERLGCQHHSHFVQRNFAPDWYHRTREHDAYYYYSCPASPTGSSSQLLMVTALKSRETAVQQPSSARAGDVVPLSSDALASTPKMHHLNPPPSSKIRLAAEMKVQKSLAQINESIRSMLSVHRTSRSGAFEETSHPLSPTSVSPPREASVPSQYVKCYVRLAQLKSEGTNETELLKEQLRLAQLSLSWERHRSLIFICKNRSLMAEHKKNGELEGLLEEAQHRIHDLETKLEHEAERRLSTEQRVFHLMTQRVTTDSVVSLPLAVGLNINLANNNNQVAEFVRANNLSPRPRPTTISVSSGEQQPPSTEPVGPSHSIPGTNSASGTTIHRAQSSSEFTSTASSNLAAIAPPPVVPPLALPPDNGITWSTMKRELDELQKQRDDLQMELSVLRQQLRQAQLEALVGTNAGEEGIISLQGSDDSSGVANKALEPSAADLATERLELLTTQLSDSRREVTVLNELMAEMKLRLDVAESDRRRLSAELTRIALCGTPTFGTGAINKFVPPQLALVGSTPAGATPAATAQQQQNQYPTLKKQVEKILLKKQEIATTSSSGN